MCSDILNVRDVNEWAIIVGNIYSIATKNERISRAGDIVRSQNAAYLYIPHRQTIAPLSQGLYYLSVDCLSVHISIPQ